MKNIPIPYGKTTLSLTCEDHELRGVVSCGKVENAGADQTGLVLEALANPIGSRPLHALAAEASTVLLITSDHTRPVPSHITVPAMLAEIRRGNPQAEIRILVATGVHRPTTKEELRTKLTDWVVEAETVIVHDAFAADMVDKGKLPSGCRFRVNPLADWADLIVSDGFIEPHFFAGFSGGRKSILPGIAGENSIKANHCGRLIGSEKARTGILDGNPIHEDMVAAAKLAGLRFIVNVVLDDDKNIVRAFAGDTFATHEAACGYSRRVFTQKPIEASVAVTSNGGYPLDQNIYQTVKSMTAAESCVRPGGMIICCSACEDGHGGEEFVRWFSQSQGPEDVLRKINAIDAEDTIADQWQAQILARVMTKATVAMVCHEKNRETVRSMGMLWFASLGEAVDYARKTVKDYDGIVAIPNGVSVIIQ